MPLEKKVPTAMSDPAHAFHPALQNGKERGQLTLRPPHLTFESAHSHQTFQLKLSALALTRGGAGESLLYIKSPQEPELTIYTVGFELLTHPALQDHEGAQALQRAVKRHKGLTRLTSALLAIALIGAPLWLISRREVMIKGLATQVPVEWEVNLGEQIFKASVNPMELMETTEIQEELKALCEPLTRLEGIASYPLKLHLIRSKVLNAFALPGGHVVIHSALLERLERPEALLAVLAHELSHVTLRHHLRSLIENLGLYTILSVTVGDLSALGGVILNNGAQLLTLKASREHEREADEEAWGLLLRAQVDPAGLAEAFRVLSAQDKGPHPEGALGSALGLLSTHPDIQERISRFESRHPTLSPEQRLPLSATRPQAEAAFVSLKRRVGSPNGEAPSGGASESGPF